MYEKFELTRTVKIPSIPLLYSSKETSDWDFIKLQKSFTDYFTNSFSAKKNKLTLVEKKFVNYIVLYLHSKKVLNQILEMKTKQTKKINLLFKRSKISKEGLYILCIAFLEVLTESSSSITYNENQDLESFINLGKL